MDRDQKVGTKELGTPLLVRWVSEERKGSSVLLKVHNVDAHCIIYSHTHT